MNAHTRPPRAADAVVIKIPMRFRTRRGRKRMIAPDGLELVPTPRPKEEADSALVKALARAHRWKRMIESGEYASIRELAKAESINESYVCRVLRLTLLAPEIAKAILDGTGSPDVTLERVMKPFPVGWNEQRDAFGLLP